MIQSKPKLLLPFRSLAQSLALLVGSILLCMTPLRSQATIPAGAFADPRYSIGYLVVTNYPGVDSTGATDSTIGLQNAINDAYSNNINFEKTGTNRGLAVFFTPGTYVIS